jgi:hypothetical protein
MQRVREEARGGGNAISSLSAPLGQVSRMMALLRGGAAGMAIVGVFRMAAQAANEFQVGANASADAVRSLSKEIEVLQGGIRRVAMEGVGMLAQLGQSIGDDIVSLLESALPGNFDSAGAQRARERQAQLDRFAEIRNRARGAEQAAEAQARREREQAERSALQERLAEERRVATEREKIAQEIAELEARLNRRTLTDRQELVRIEASIAQLRHNLRTPGVGDNGESLLALRRAEVERMEILKRIQESNDRARKAAQDEYIRAEERLMRAREESERRIADIIRRRVEQITPATDESPAQRSRRERDEARLQRLVQRLRRAEERGLQGQDRLRDQVADAAGRVAGSQVASEDVASRISSVIQRGVESAIGDSVRAREEANAGIEKMAGDMERARASLEAIEQALTVGVR